MVTPLDRARQRGRRLYKSSGFQDAYVAGARAAIDGRSVDVCPYKQRRGGWLAWRRAWLRGHQSIRA